jgi:accessory gene regulator protein AgrB
MVEMEERRTKLVVLLGFDIFLYMLMKNVVGIQVVILQGEWEKLAILSVVYENIRRIKRNIWSQDRMLGFVDRSLLGS